MRETLEFVFSSFWTWSGTVVLTLVFGDAVHGLLRRCGK